MEKTEPDTDDAEEKTEFTYNELSDAAKQTAREQYNDLCSSDQWWDFVYQDAVQIGALLGIEIGTRSYNSYSGPGQLQEPDIYFQLHVQGSGACYSGELHIDQLKDCLARVQAEVGEHNDALNELATQGQALYEQIVVRAVTRRMLGQSLELDGDEGVVEISPTTSLGISGNDRCYRTTIEAGDYCLPEAIEQAANAYVDAFADWIYSALEDEADYMASSEHAEEGIHGNDYLFDEDGNQL
jgi:hypothetical protein